MSAITIFKPPNYHAYLVRLWQADPHTPWRASAQCATTGVKTYFATLDELYTFLVAQTTIQPSVAPDPSSEE